MSPTITALDKLQKTLGDAQRALTQLDRTIAALTFDPADPASVAAAVAEMERAVDAKMAPYRGNVIIEPLTEKSKMAFREAIERRAAAART